MTKRLLSVAVALLMVLALVPMSVFAAEPEKAATKDGYVAHFTGAQMTVNDPAVNGKFWWVINAEDWTDVFSGQWLVSYDHDYLDAVNFSFNWSGSIMRLINNAAESGTPIASDTFSCPYNLHYQGNTGDVPVGEEGVEYVNFGLYITTFVYDGVQLGGMFVRIQFQWINVPTTSMRLPINLEVIDLTSEIQVDIGEELPMFNGVPYPAEGITVDQGYVDVIINGAPIVEPTEVPVVTEAPIVTEAPMAPTAVTYTGETLTVDEPAVGDTFNWHLDISEYSRLFAGRWLVDQDERFISVKSYMTEWSQGIQTLIADSWDDDEAYSDIPFFGVTPNYEGGTGGAPAGEEGNIYSIVGMYLTTFSYEGVQMGGHMVRLTYQWDAIPTKDDLQHDKAGDYLPMNISVVEAASVTTVADNGDYNYGEQDITLVNGKIYVNLPEEEPELTKVTYTGETLTVNEPAEGDTFNWHLDISDNSRLFAGRWLVDQDERFISVKSYMTEWSQGIQTLIADSWDDDEAYSDIPFFGVTPNYEGGTGGAPAGEEGNIYSIVGMYLTTFSYEGVQMGGHMVRLTYQWDAIPTYDDLLQDETGYYLPMNISVVEAASVTTVADNGDYNYGDQDITLVHGKIYVTLAENYDLTINYVYADGTEAAPTYTETMAAGTAYSVPSPAIEGYTANPATVSGTLDGDTTVTVVYNPISYQLRIYYLNSETDMAIANAYFASIPYGQSYSVTSPTITGWHTETPVVEGVMGVGGAEYDVYYVRDVHNVTVHYVDAEGNPMAEDYTAEVGYGLDYSATSPVIPGYTASQETVSGTMGTEDVEVTVVYTAIEYTITWVVDGVETTETYTYGQTPVYPNGTPVKEGNAQYSYVFSGWDPEVVDVVGDATYTAIFDEIVNQYTVTWVIDGAEETENYYYGQIPTHADPVKDGYNFIGWDPEIVEVTGDATYTAVFELIYVPVPPVVEGEYAELRERATQDGKFDLRFVFKVTFNDSYIVNGGETYGPTNEYYQIARFWIVLQATGTPLTIEGKELYSMADDSFEFTAVLKNIPANKSDVPISATPYLTIVLNGESTTISCDPLVSSVDDVNNN